MPPKRSASGPKSRSQQSTLAFHGASNRVTKPGTRAQNAKKNLVDQSTAKSSKSDVTEITATENDEPTNAEAAIIEQTEQEVVAQKATSSPEEEEARKISKPHITAYWNKKEEERRAPRVHQQDLGVHEKILREFDMSSQYGPCTGIARLKRWKRAHRLRLGPPIEVLAVLLKEQEEKDNASVQTSRVDELLNSRNIELEVGGA